MGRASFEEHAAEPRLHSILVVDDEVLIRMAVADHLRECGFHVIEAASGDEALRVLETEEPVDVVFSDVQMPGSLDGFGLARWVRAHRPRLHVLLTSGVVRTAEIAKDLCEQGPEAVLGKPYDHQDLVQRLRRLLASDP